MKRSELKEAIKAEIKSVLSENMNLSEIKDQGLIDGINAITRDINMFGPPKLKSVVEIQTYVEAFGDGVEEEGRRISRNMKAAMRGGGDEKSLSGLIGLREEDEPTAADLKKADSVASAANKLQKLVKKMKDKAKDFKAAEGKAKEKIKDELKAMTAEKKKLEKAL